LIIKPSTDLVERREELETSPAKPEEILIEEIDKQIVRILTQDARTPFNTIAKRLDISTNNVIQRYKKLRERKVLTLSTIIVDLHKLGYNAIHINFLKLETTSKMSEIRRQILRVPNMTMLIEHIGAYDLRVEFPVTEIEDIFRTTEQIRKIGGIAKVDLIVKRIEPTQFPTPLYDKIVFNMSPPLY
jgi:Lrp/AsnC family transcriptional regulator for asnA, asnC and gidA